MDKGKLIKLASLIFKLNRYETEKGVMVTTEEIAEGVEVLTEDGEVFPDGEYQVEEKKIVVKDGKVESVEVVEEKKEEEKVEEVVEEVVAEEQTPTEEPDEKDLKIKELEGLLADRDAVIAELTEKVKALEEKAAKPVEEPVQLNKITPDEKEEKKGALRYFEN